MTDYKSIAFGVDLIEASKAEYDFLLEVQNLDYLRNVDVLRYSIRRYEMLWLPLVASQEENIQSTYLIPPIDIAWVWHCHMLAPHKYAEYCKSQYGRVLDHSVIKPKTGQKLTQDIWAKAYPTEPFYLGQEIEHGQVPPVPMTYKSQMSYDLLSAILRQQDFFYNVHLPHYRDTKFLQTALTRYQKFLYLKRKHPSEFLVPCYDIDLIWHVHQLHPVDYARVTCSLLGRVLVHDDTTTDRYPGSKLSLSDENTRKLWRLEYNESFYNFGAMYRGDSPRSKLHRVTRQDIEKMCGRKANVVIQQISVILSNEIGEKNVKLKIFKTDALSWNKQFIKKLTGKMENMMWNNQEISFAYGSYNPTLDVELSTRAGMFCGYSHKLAWFQEKFGHYLNSPEFQQGGEFQIDRDMWVSRELSAAKFFMKGTISHPVLDDIVLSLEPGSYEEANMPTDVEQLWGPVPLPKSNAQNICQVASHKLRDQNGNVVFTCRLIHSVSVMTSVVHVFYQDKMAAVAHVIGSDQLPMKSQVMGNLTLNPGAGERAIVIKTEEGDALVLVGRWVGFVRGQEGAIGKLGVRGNPGHLQVNVYRVDHKSPPRKEEIHLSENSPIRYEGFQLDLKESILTCRCDHAGQIPQYVGLSFSIALLHVLCVPRPSNWRPGQSLKPNVAYRGPLPIQRFPDESMPFMMAAGLLLLTPSNHYIYHTYGANVCAGCAAGGVVSDSYGIGFEHDQCVINTDGGLYGGGGESGGGCGGCGGCGSWCGSGCHSECAGGCGGG